MYGKAMKERKNTATKVRQHTGPARTQSGWESILSRYWAWIVLALIVAFAAWLRIGLRDFPLERDEGEYAYMGQLMLQGVPPYQGAYNMKFPGTYAAYALIMAIFGQTVAGIHIGVLLANAGAIVLVFLITRRLWDPLAGLMAAATYALLSMSQASLGMAGHATHFVVLPMLAGVLLMLKATDSGRAWQYFMVGVLMGLAVLMKQPAAFFVAMAGLYILWVHLRQCPRQWTKTGLSLGTFALGVALPLAVTGLILWRAGVFGKFWYWTIVYAQTYTSQITLTYAPMMLKLYFSVMAVKTWPLWLLAGIGFVLLCLSPAGRKWLPFMVLFTLFSFLAVCPGFYFRNHYFIMLMPVAAMLIGAGLFSARRLMATQNRLLRVLVPLVVFLAIWGYVFYEESRFLTRLGPQQACTETYLDNPFMESPVIAAYLKAHTEPGETIVVLGSEPQIYFYANRRSATGYIYTYALMESHANALAMQKEMVQEIEKASPRYIVLVNMKFSWVVRPTSEKYLFDWIDQQFNKYDVVGFIDVYRGGANYYWDAAAAGRKPVGDSYILVLRRK
jgi:hypothetical protein